MTGGREGSEEMQEWTGHSFPKSLKQKGGCVQGQAVPQGAYLKAILESQSKVGFTFPNVFFSGFRGPLGCL
jgi:hypothetical protein